MYFFVVNITHFLLCPILFSALPVVDESIPVPMEKVEEKGEEKVEETPEVKSEEKVDEKADYASETSATKDDSEE